MKTICKIFMIWLDALLSPFGEEAPYPSPETFESFSKQDDFWMALNDGLRNRWHSLPWGMDSEGIVDDDKWF